MPVDSLLTQLFLSKEAILLILGVFLFTYIIRTVVEGVWSAVSESRIWTKILLPLGPILNGMLMALASDSLLWPVGIKSFFWGRVFYGGGCGLVAGWSYNRIRDWAKGSSDPAPMLRRTPVIEAGAVVEATTVAPVEAEPVTEPTPELVGHELPAEDPTLKVTP